MKNARLEGAPPMVRLLRLLPHAALALLVAPAAEGQEIPATAAALAHRYRTNAAIEPAISRADRALGAAQGASVLDRKVYAYGDAWLPPPRVGVIKEYGLDLAPTGRMIKLAKDGRPLILHPTGLTRDERFGTFLGDTVNQKATIYRLDWERAWADGNLDRAILDAIPDDAAVNGCRPIFVALEGRALLATADYGAVRPEIRLLDPEKLLQAKRTSAPGVVVHRILCGPYNQNLAWDGASGRLTCVQNVIEGRGWRLDTLDLARAVADGRADGPGARIAAQTFPGESELEGYCTLPDGSSLFVAATLGDNLVLGRIKPAPEAEAILQPARREPPRAIQAAPNAP